MSLRTINSETKPTDTLEDLLPLLKFEFFSLGFLKALNALDMLVLYSKHTQASNHKLVVFLNNLNQLYQLIFTEFELAFVDHPEKGMAAEHFHSLLMTLLPNDKQVLQCILEKASALLTRLLPTLNNQVMYLLTALQSAAIAKIQLVEQLDTATLQIKYLIVKDEVSDDIQSVMKQIAGDEKMMMVEQKAFQEKKGELFSPPSSLTPAEKKDLYAIKTLTAEHYKAEYQHLFKASLKYPNLFELYVDVFSVTDFYDFLEKMTCLGEYITQHSDEALLLKKLESIPASFVFLQRHQKQVRIYLSKAQPLLSQETTHLMQGLRFFENFSNKPGMEFTIKLKKTDRDPTEFDRETLTLFLKNRTAEDSGYRKNTLVAKAKITTRILQFLSHWFAAVKSGLWMLVNLFKNKTTEKKPLCSGVSPGEISEMLTSSSRHLSIASDSKSHVSESAALEEEIKQDSTVAAVAQNESKQERGKTPSMLIK